MSKTTIIILIACLLFVAIMVFGYFYVGDIESYKTSPETQSYNYSFDNVSGYLMFTTYGGLSDIFSEDDHGYTTYYGNSEKNIEIGIIDSMMFDPRQDTAMKPFIDKIKGMSDDSYTQAKIAIGVVQNIPYDREKVASSYGSIDPYYPYETLHKNVGTGFDKTLLLWYLLDKLGYDVVIFHNAVHHKIGIKSDVDHQSCGTGYAFIETTVPSDVPHQDHCNYDMIFPSSGKKSIDFKYW